MNYKNKGLPTKELKPKIYEQFRRDYSAVSEEPLPEGHSLRNKELMDLVFRSIN
jgi:hypothetical protein